MIQRTQSLLLVAVVAVMACFSFTKIWVKVNEKTADEIIFTPISLTYLTATVDENQISNITETEESTMHIIILAALISAHALLPLINYNNRVKQMKISFVNSLLIGILFVLMYYQITEAEKLMPHPLYGEYKIGFFLPLLALVFNIMAHIYIKRDEDLVRSSDRIR